MEGDARILWSCNLLQTWWISRIWFSKVSEKIAISSSYAQTVFPISPSRTYSITRIAVHGALLSPCSITLHAKVPKGVLMVLSFSSSGATLFWKYQLDKSMVDRYFALATVLRIMDSLGIVLSFLIVMSFLGTKSAKSLISPLRLSFGNMLTGLLASHE